MAWALPEHPREAVDAAGSTLIAPFDVDEVARYEDALRVINNWRAAHAFPLNTFQVTLRNKARQVDPNTVVAQRIKRLSSIEQKLTRLTWLKLSTMQDIGGCRAVVKPIRSVKRLVRLYETSDLKHSLDHKDDYIDEPKKSGYRGVHLIYSYHSDRTQTYEGLKIEVQLRSQLQHAWATAVETVGTFSGQALKSSQGEKAWLRFFALMGSAIALRERSPAVPDTPSNEKELVEELRTLAKGLDVEARLTVYGAALNVLQNPEAGMKSARYFLLSLETGDAPSITITGYKTAELPKASADYLELERENQERPRVDAVLVSVESLAALRRAYPNYFLDTRLFLDEVRQAIRPASRNATQRRGSTPASRSGNAKRGLKARAAKTEN
jgi:hypothetical protein